MKRKIKKFKTVIVVLISLVLAFSLFGCETGGVENDGQIVKPPKPAEPQVYEVTFIAAGDNLIHTNIFRQAKERATDGGYDFYPAYKEVEPLIQSADIAMINQETPLASSLFPPSGYPSFNSPKELLPELCDLGFNVFSIANNHMVDKGKKGLAATIEVMRDEGVAWTGAYDKNDDTPSLMTKNNITFGFLGFTEHTNGIPEPSNMDFDVVYTSETELIRDKIEALRPKCDVLVVSVHWGDEDSHKVADRQRELASEMAMWGADIIIGHHPHVLQEDGFIESPRGRTYVAYSLGNFISSQRPKPNLIGGLARLNIQKTDGKISIESKGIEPIITHYGYKMSNVRVMPLSAYNKELQNTHAAGITMTYANGVMERIFPKE